MAETFLHGVEVVDINDGARPIQTAATSVIGIVGTAPRADDAAFPLNTPVLIANSLALTARLTALPGGANGTLPDALDSIFDQAGASVVVVRVAEGATEAETLVNVTSGQFEGVHALLAAEGTLGVKPRILIAPGFTHQRAASAANATIAELLGIAERLRAVIIADGPSTTDADALTYARDFGSKRVYVIDPRIVKVGSTGTSHTAHASACVAGVIARSDNERGWWWSPSNQAVNGIVGLARAIDFSLGDAGSRANLLNASNVATFIRQNGFRLWGNRTLSSDAKWAFLCVVRTADIIADSLQAAHLWAVDRGITKNYVTDVQEGVNAFLRDLTAKGAILGGSCWLDPALNSASAIASGKVYWDFDFTPVYPAEHLTFWSHLVDNYIAEIL